MQYIPGHGPYEPKLLILLDCPSYKDSVNGKLASDTKELDLLLKEAGINRGDCFITAVSKYYIPPNEGRKRQTFQQRAELIGVDINQQLSDLQNEITSLKPNCILSLGKNSLWALNGKYNIEQFRGSILFGMGRKFIPTYNPAGLGWHDKEVEFRGYWNRQVILFDMMRALAQSESSEYKIPQRQLSVCRNSHELYEFYNSNKNNLKLSVDIESGGHCVPICIGMAFNKTNGFTVPLWNTDGISNIPDSDLINCWRILSDILINHAVIGQNFNYDRDKLKRLGFIIKNLHSDTMMKAFAINPELPKGLAFNTSLYTEEPFYKDEGMYEGSINDLLIGCARDACVTYEINENMEKDLIELDQVDYFYNFIMKLPDLYLEIENTGFGVDEPRRDELFKKYIEWSERLQYELFQLIGKEVNVNSPKQVSELLFDELKLPKRDGTGEEEITALLNLQSVNNKQHRLILEKILEKRRVEKTISTYLMALPDFDGRMKTTCFPCLETGRSKNGQQEPPIRPKVDIVGQGKQKDMKILGIAFQTITKHGDIGQDVRSMYVP